MGEWLIVGLGNPGERYAKTRHNVGFIVLDAIAENFQFSTPKENKFPSRQVFNFQKKWNAQTAEGVIADHHVLLAKPQTFMNSSGETVKSLCTTYPIPHANIVVIHDDIDLPLGTVRVSRNRGSAGHKGAESVIKALGTKNFTRMRVGIQPKHGKPKDVEAFVLKPFTRQEKPLVESALWDAAKALKTIVRAGVAKAMKNWN